MNFGVAEQLRRAGYPASVIEIAGSLRERFARWAGGAADAHLADDLAASAREPWWTLAYLPAELPDQADRTAWHKEMSFDPLPIYGRIRVPTLIVYGGDDIWAPVAESLANWASLDISGIKSVMIPNARHNMSTPTEDLSTDYERTLGDWITDQADPGRP